MVNKDSHKVMLYSSVLRRRLNNVSDGAALSEDGRAFQARGAATGNARSPSVEGQVSIRVVEEAAASGSISDAVYVVSRRLTDGRSLSCSYQFHET